MAAVGIGALLANAAAHLATALAVLDGWRARVCAAFLVAAGGRRDRHRGVSAVVPRWASGLRPADAPPADWVDVVHGASVGVYELFTLAAMLTLTVSALRRSSAPPRWLGWVSLAFAAGSVALIFQTNGDHIGMWQRLWLANNLAWLLLSHGSPPRGSMRSIESLDPD